MGMQMRTPAGNWFTAMFLESLFIQNSLVAVGSGVQILVCIIVTLIFAVLGFVSPAYRGSLLQGMLLLFTFAGSLAGYTSARLYKMWKGEDWKTTTLLTAFLYPATVFIFFFFIDLFVWGTKSSGAVPFQTMFALLVLWFGISVPLVFLGAYFGYNQAAVSLPVYTNAIPRQIPKQTWCANIYFTSLLAGIIPFGAAFTELFFHHVLHLVAPVLLPLRFFDARYLHPHNHLC